MHFLIWLGAALFVLFCTWFWIRFRLWRDIPYGIILLRALIGARMIGWKKITAADFWEQRVKKTPNNIAVVFEGRTFTYAEMDARANQVAQWAVVHGIVRGDVVALLMENRPEFIFTWIGLCKLGVTCSLLNNHLRGKPLLHTLQVCDARFLIFGAECVESVVSIVKDLPVQIRIYSVDGDCKAAVYPRECPDAAVAWVGMPAKAPPAAVRVGAKQSDVLFYIYTSGTTGLPKAAKIKHSRFLSGGLAFSIVTKVKALDRIFCPLPIYHSAAGIIGIGMCWNSGCALVLARKFSASKFWDECRQNSCTVIQYVGELCRYLVAQPPTLRDKDHQVRLAVGNGMRADIWREFVSRFGVNVFEFYGSTEGNVTLWNPFGVIGSVGTNEPGVVIGKIVESNSALAFEGYSNAEHTNRKILKDVFVKGDAYFMSGDLLRLDSEGFFFFVDRLGDTFRWKGENVSTNEVAEVCSSCPGFAQQGAEINVYGVSVPCADGRCGMAAIVAPNMTSLDMQNLARYVMEHLPSYAWPLFLRKLPQMDLTSTFKHRKVELVEQGFDPETVRDPLFFLDSSARNYIPLDKSLYQKICSGGVRI